MEKEKTLMKNNHKYSFILPAYKREFLKEAIDSILRQSYADFELVIVDDCSPEKLDEVVSQYDDERISYHRNQENLGRKDLIESWNHALSFTKGDYVVLASDDDVYYPDFLEEVDKLFTKYPNINEVRARVQRIDEEGNIIDIDQLYQEYMTQEEFMFWMGKGLIDCQANHVFRTSPFKAKGWCVNFPCAWFSDDAIALIMAENGIAHTEKPLFKFRRSTINVSHTANASVLKQKIKACREYYSWVKTNLPKVPFFNYRVKERCFTDLSRSLYQMPYSQWIYVITELNQIKWLYSKEKIMLFLSFILRYHRE